MPRSELDMTTPPTDGIGRARIRLSRHAHAGSWLKPKRNHVEEGLGTAAQDRTPREEAWANCRSVNWKSTSGCASNLASCTAPESPAFCSLPAEITQRASFCTAARWYSRAPTSVSIGLASACCVQE